MRIVKPLPEIVDRLNRRFAVKPIHDTSAKVCFEPPELIVPLTDAPAHYGARLHELGHLKWSEPDPVRLARKHKVSVDWLQVCEDCRINTLLALSADTRIDWLTGSPEYTASLVRETLSHGTTEQLVAMAIARTGVASERELIQSLLRGTERGQSALAIACRASAIIHNDCFRPDGAIAGAKFLGELFAMPERLDLPPVCPAPDGELASVFDSPDFVKSMLQVMESDDGSWGQMTVETPRRTVPCRAAYKHRKHTFGDEGCIPVALHRLPTDGRVFRHPLPRKVGGSILVDMSGSMRLPWQRVTKFLEQCPLATVGVYSGKSKEGTLIVLACNGMRVEACPKMPGGNIVDGPALRWLTKQPGPRFWVSDGITTGIGDTAYGYDECALLCKLGRITQLDSLDSALTALLPTAHV